MTRPLPPPPKFAPRSSLLAGKAWGAAGALWGTRGGARHHSRLERERRERGKIARAWKIITPALSERWARLVAHCVRASARGAKSDEQKRSLRILLANQRTIDPQCGALLTLLASTRPLALAARHLKPVQLVHRQLRSPRRPALGASRPRALQPPRVGIPLGLRIVASASCHPTAWPRNDFHMDSMVAKAADLASVLHLPTIVVAADAPVLVSHYGAADRKTGA